VCVVIVLSRITTNTLRSLTCINIKRQRFAFIINYWRTFFALLQSRRTKSPSWRIRCAVPTNAAGLTAGKTVRAIWRGTCRSNAEWRPRTSSDATFALKCTRGKRRWRFIGSTRTKSSECSSEPVEMFACFSYRFDVIRCQFRSQNVYNLRILFTLRSGSY